MKGRTRHLTSSHYSCSLSAYYIAVHILRYCYIYMCNWAHFTPVHMVNARLADHSGLHTIKLASSGQVQTGHLERCMKLAPSLTVMSVICHASHLISHCHCLRITCNMPTWSFSHFYYTVLPTSGPQISGIQAVYRAGDQGTSNRHSEMKYRDCWSILSTAHWHTRHTVISANRRSFLSLAVNLNCTSAKSKPAAHLRW